MIIARHPGSLRGFAQAVPMDLRAKSETFREPANKFGVLTAALIDDICTTLVRIPVQYSNSISSRMRPKHYLKNHANTILV